MIVSDQMHAIEKKINNRSVTSKWKKCFDNLNLKLHVNPLNTIIVVSNYDDEL